jgi:hypothetical protein
MTPDPEGHMEDITMGSLAGEEIGGDSEAIVRQLEKSLPRWQGFEELGWMSEVSKASIHKSTAPNLGPLRVSVFTYLLCHRTGWLKLYWRSKARKMWRSSPNSINLDYVNANMKVL